MSFRPIADIVRFKSHRLTVSINDTHPSNPTYAYAYAIEMFRASGADWHFQGAVYLTSEEFSAFVSDLVASDVS